MRSPHVQRQLIKVQEKFPDMRVVDVEGAILLILPTFALPSGFRQSQVRLALRVGALYPSEKLDLFWVEPTLQRLDGAKLPNLMNPDVMLGGEHWMQISWHDVGPYDPAQATLVGYLTGLRRWFLQ